jgi:hypothetical protein
MGKAMSVPKAVPAIARKNFMIAIPKRGNVVP